MFKKVLLTALLALVSFQGLLLAKPKKVVFLHGARSHASGDHEFQAGSHLLANHLNKQNAVEVNAIVISGWPSDDSVLDDADAIVIYSDATKVVQNGWEKMDQLVKEGVGLMFMHYAVHPSADKGEKYFKPWVGGYFKNGQSVNPFWRADITPMKGHEISKGVGKLQAIDEWYYELDQVENALPLGVATPNEKNLLRINNIWTKAGFMAKNKPQSLLWGLVREDGSRGAGFTGGHKHQNWALDNYRRLILNTIVWISGLEVPEGGVPTKALTEDELNENLDDYGDKTNRILLPTPKDLEIANNGPWKTPEEHAESRNRGKKKNKKKKK